MGSGSDPTQQQLVSRAMDLAIRLGLALLLVVWCYDIVAPFVTPILWGVVISIGTYPVFRWLSLKLGGRTGLAATLLTLFLLTVLLVPSVLLGGALFDSGYGLAEQLRDGTLKVPAPRESVAEWPLIGERVYQFWTLAASNLEEAIGRLAPQLKVLARWLLGAMTGVGLGILQFVFSIIIAGVFWVYAKGGERAVRTVLTQLVGERGGELTELSHATVQSVVRGILGIAVIQAILAGLGFLAIGVPGAGVWAFVCLVLAIVQIDILLILIPMSLYMFSTELGTGLAIAFLIWNVLVGLLNNVLKPILLGRGVATPMLVVLVGAIGGMISSGILGLFVGPVILALGYELTRAWFFGPRAREEEAA